MPQVELFRAGAGGFTPRGAWASGVVYGLSDIVTYQNATYRVTAAHTSEAISPPDASAYYELWAGAGPVGPPGPEGPRGLQGLPGPSHGNVAGLRTQDVSVVADGDLHTISGHTTSGDGGGGTFRYDAASSEADDDGVVIAPSAGSGRWIRVLPGGRLTPYMFGGKTGVDATAAVQAVINKVRGSYDNGAGTYRYIADLAGKSWRVTSIDATQARSPGMTITSGGLYGVGPGQNVLDLAGSNSCELYDIHIWGDKTNAPGVGFLLSKATNGAGGFPDAKQHKLAGCTANGYFTKSAYVNFASEVCSHSGCAFQNKSRSLSAYSMIITGAAATLDKYVGGVTSAYTTIPAAIDGVQSCILHDLGHLQALRVADVNLSVSNISNANPAVVTVDATALTNAGLANGDLVFFYDVAGMTQLNKNTYTVANINLAAGTFSLQGIDSTTYGTFTSGNVQNRTGPAMLMGSCSGVSCKSGYVLTYGAETVWWDLENGGSMRQINLEVQPEHQPPAAVRIALPASGTNVMQDVRLKILSVGQEFRDAVIKPVAATNGTGTVRIDGLDLAIASMGVSPAQGVFQSRNLIALRNARIHIPLSATLTPTMAANFVGISGTVYAADTDTTDRYGTVTQR